MLLVILLFFVDVVADFVDVVDAIGDIFIVLDTVVNVVVVHRYCCQ